MSQEIKIPVSADVKGAEKGADSLADALNSVAKATGAIGDQSNKAAAGLGKVVDRMREIKAAQAFLSSELKKPISERDAGVFVDNMTASRKFGFRDFGSVEGWIGGHTGYYGRNANAARRKAIAVNMRGTEYTEENGTPGPTGGGGGGGGGGEGGGGGGGFGMSVNGAKSAAVGFAKSMLALAGINSVMGLAGRAIDNANEESVGTDTLKRQMGDLGVSFEDLREQARNAGQGLGVTWVESVRLAQSYAKTVGNLNYRDNVGRSVRLGAGLSRSYGMDLEAGNQFFGTMARTGVARDEAGQRRLALMIGDAVARSGYSGKVDELLGAVADYSNMAARLTLSTPNIGGYLGGMTSLMGKYTGLDPAGTAAMIGQADSSIRRGGAKGEASMNFLYSAMRQGHPGMSPLQAQAMWEGGLFATGDSTFGQGPLKGMGPGGNKTVFEMMMGPLRQHYGKRGPLWMAAAMSGMTGLNLSQSMALTQMDTNGQLGGGLKALQAAGVNPMSVSASGWATIGKLGNAKGLGDLRGIAGTMHDRGDLTSDQKSAIEAAQKMSNPTEMRNALIKVAASLGQEKTDGEQTRQSITDLNDSLTRIGNNLMPVVNRIRDAVVAMAGQLAPGFLDTTGGREGSTPWAQSEIDKVKDPGRKAALSKSSSTLQKSAMAYFTAQGWTHEQAAAIVGRLMAESNLDTRAVGDHGNAIGLAQWHSDRWNKLKGWATKQGITDPFSYQAQFGFVDYELRHQFSGAGSGLRTATNRRDRMGAMLAYELPKGYNQGPWEKVSGWGDQSAATQRLEGSVDVNVNVKHPDGTVEKHTQMKRITKPAPAGAAPRVPVSYSSHQDYR